VVPEEAEIVRRVFTMLADGMGYLKIAKQLNAEGVPSPTRRGWCGSGVREMAFHDLYAGRIVYGKTKWVDRDGRRRNVDTSPGEWITVEAPHLRIVDQPLWERAHQRLDGTRAAYRASLKGQPPGRPPAGGAESPHLLTGFLRCTCGGNLQVSGIPRAAGGSPTTSAASTAGVVRPSAPGSEPGWSRSRRRS
jgi:site-specific DNA recombinase